MNTKKKFLISTAIVIILLVISILVTIVFTLRPQKETAEVSGSVSETTILAEKETESTFYYYETNETDVIKDIKIIPIGD